MRVSFVFFLQGFPETILAVCLSAHEGNPGALIRPGVTSFVFSFVVPYARFCSFIPQT